MKQSETNSKTQTSSNGRVKAQTGSPKVSLKDLQHDSDEINRCRRNPVYFYNTYVRKEGQPVLTEEEYNKMIIAEFRIKGRSGREYTAIDKMKYPLTPDQSFKIVPEIRPIDNNLSKSIEDLVEIIEESKKYISDNIGISTEKLNQDKNDNSKTDTTNTI